MTKNTYFLLMHRTQSDIAWVELEWDEWQQIDYNPQQYQIFVVDGHSAKILIATEDKTMTRQNALKAASCFVFGHYQKITVDLNRLVATKEQGEPHGSPRHPPY